MSRIEEIAAPVTIREKVAPLTEIHWNPDDDSGVVKFWVQEIVTDKVTEAFIGIEEPYDGKKLISIPLENLMAREIVTDLGTLTGLQIMLAVKKLFDELCNE